MSARTIYDHAPLGAIVRYSDGASKPPVRFSRKLAAWEDRNNGGRLIRKQAASRIGNTILPASFTLHKGDYGANGVIVLRVHQTFSIESKLSFIVTERPQAGAVRILDRPGEGAELVYLAANGADAEEWLTRHGYPRAVLDEVTADEIGADTVEGRTAA